MKTPVDPYPREIPRAIYTQVQFSVRHPSELLALSFGAVFAIAISPNAFAQSKKLSYEQAWAQCKSEVNRTVPGDQASARTSAGGACMHKYGYRLKKKK